MPRILYIPNGTLISNIAMRGAAENLSDAGVREIFTLVTHGATLDAKWAAYYGITLPLLLAELEYIP
jgi:methanogenic corrinoid protein MtbC1